MFTDIIYACTYEVLDLKTAIVTSIMLAIIAMAASMLLKLSSVVIYGKNATKCGFQRMLNCGSYTFFWISIILLLNSLIELGVHNVLIKK